MTDIFCVTYAPDNPWLEYMLRSVVKYARGFRQVVLVFPEHDEIAVEQVVAPFRRHLQVKMCPTPEPDRGHLRQNAHKTSADTFSDADFFLHMDADCLFTGPVTPLSFTTDGKPDIYWRFYRDIQSGVEMANGTVGGVPWQGVTQNAIRIPTEVETMRHWNHLYPRYLYEATRAQVERVHGVPFLEYVLNAPRIGAAFHGYSEFNALGSIAWYLYPRSFNFIAHYVDPMKDLPVKQFWSHWVRQDPAKFHNEIVPELEKITANYGQSLAA